MRFGAMRAAFGVLLFCLGLFLLGTHPEYGIIKGARAQFGCGIGAPGAFTGCGAVAASCAGFSIDGAAHSQPATGSTTSTQTITTTHANEVIFSLILENGNQTVTGTADTAGLTWTSPRASAVGGSGRISESWAVSGGTLSGDTITTTYSANSGFIETIVFGVVGAHTASPFDSGGSSNVPVTASSSPVSVTTNNANTLILGLFKNGGTGGSLASGWSAVGGSVTFANFMLAEYQAFTSAQSSLSVSDPSGSANGGIGDALVCGP